jgi:hypothetical protein
LNGCDDSAAAEICFRTAANQDSFVNIVVQDSTDLFSVKLAKGDGKFFGSAVAKRVRVSPALSLHNFNGHLFNEKVFPIHDLNARHKSHLR